MKHRKNKQEIIPPEGGWKERTWYLVDVSFSFGNPIHQSLFYTGFLDKEGYPCGYNGFVPLNGPGGEVVGINSARYCRAIHAIFESKEEIQNRVIKNISEVLIKGAIK